MGKGKIVTVKNGRKYSTSVFLSEGGVAQYDDQELSKPSETDEPDGTEVTITVTNQRIKIPEYNRFKEQLANHYALRLINSSSNRQVKLIFEDSKRSSKNTIPIKFKLPSNKKVLDETIKVPGFGDEVLLKVYESDEPLRSPRMDPCALAGIIIRSEDVIYDNELFKYDSEPAALYFFGEAKCDGINVRLRSGETGIVDANRGGLEWRHPYCQSLAKVIEDSLEKLIAKKKESMLKQPKKEMKESTKKLLRKLCAKLNELAKAELDEEEIEVSFLPSKEVEELMIKPERANLELGVSRSFTVYAPDTLIRSSGKHVQLETNSTFFILSSNKVCLEPHPSYSGVWYGRFNVMAIAEEAEGVASATLGDEEASCLLIVAPLGRRKKGKLTIRKGGFISDIVDEALEDPPQRVSYEDGLIKI